MLLLNKKLTVDIIATAKNLLIAAVLYFLQQMGITCLIFHME